MEATVLTSLHLRKSDAVKKQPKQRTKKKTRPIKVKYISNPMKVETCVSKFRELVQELTGQDAADLPPEPTIFSPPASAPPLVPPTLSPEAENPVPEFLADNLDHHQPPFDGAVDPVPDYFEPLDGGIFVNQMADNFSGYFTNVFYKANAWGSVDSV